MKRLLALILLFCCLVSYACAESLGIDFDSLSKEDLKYLFNESASRLYGKGAAEEGVTIPMGEYTVGKDIMPGRYTIKSNEKVPNSMGVVTHEVDGVSETLYELYFVKDFNEARIVLEEGDVLEIFSGDIFSDATYTLTLNQ